MIDGTDSRIGVVKASGGKVQFEASDSKNMQQQAPNLENRGGPDH